MAAASVFAEVIKGRSLCFSPPWGLSAPSVVFDRNSGDYWVLSALARRVLGMLNQGQALSTVDICEALQAQQAPEEEWGDALEATLDDLVRANILELSVADIVH
jgi:PqqD family protein of HPr-rel-A system